MGEPTKTWPMGHPTRDTADRTALMGGDFVSIQWMSERDPLIQN